MGVIGRPRESQVPRQERVCPIHGLTTHAGNVPGNSLSLVWKCMACNNDSQKNRYAAKKAGTFEPTCERTVKKPVREYAQCKTHFIALNALGKCDDCED